MVVSFGLGRATGRLSLGSVWAGGRVELGVTEYPGSPSAPVYQWVAGRLQKVMSWQLAVADTFGPVGCSVSVKVLSRNFRDLLPKLREASQLPFPTGLFSPPAPSTPTPGTDDGDDDLEEHSRIAFPKALPAAQIGMGPPVSTETLSFGEAAAQASVFFRTVPADAFHSALAALVQGLAAIPSLAPMARLLQRTPDGRQAPNVLAGWHIVPGPVQQHARQALHAWLGSQRPAVGMGVPAPAHHKSAVLGQALGLVKERSSAVSDWVLLAFQIASDLLAPDTLGLADVFDPSGVQDASSMTAAVATTVVRAAAGTDLAGLLIILDRRFPRPVQNDGWVGHHPVAALWLQCPLSSSVPPHHGRLCTGRSSTW